MPNQEVAELLNESLMLISENDEIKALEEEKHFENFDITISEIEEKNSFYEIAESFRKNLDFSLLISDKEDKEELEFIDLINVFMLTSKNEFSFEWFHDMIKREIEKMVEHMETNNRKIIKLVKKGFLFDKPFSKQKQVRQSASGKYFFLFN